MFVCVWQDRGGQSLLAFQFIRMSHLHEIPLVGIPRYPGFQGACLGHGYGFRPQERHSQGIKSVRKILILWNLRSFTNGVFLCEMAEQLG